MKQAQKNISLEELSNSEFFLHVSKLMLKQKKKCVCTETGVLFKYRHEKLASPVGFCIPDEDYKDETEYWHHMSIPVIAKLGQDKCRYLTELELIHETVPISKWKESMVALAYKLGLGNVFDIKTEEEK